MTKTDFFSRDIVSCHRDTKGLKDSAPVHTSPDMFVDQEVDVCITSGLARFEVAVVSTYNGGQRLKLTGLDAWFRAEDFTLVQRVSKAQKVNDVLLCVHCKYPRGRHSEKDGHCLRAGYAGNRWSPDLKLKPQWTAALGTLFEIGVDRVDLNQLEDGQWLLVAVEFKHRGSDEAGVECRVYDPNGEEYFFFARPEAVMGTIEHPEWAKPPLPDEPPVWTVVKTVGKPGPGEGPITVHVRTKAAWVDLSGNRRKWPEVCSLDHQGQPEVLEPESVKALRAELTDARERAGRYAADANLAESKVEQAETLRPDAESHVSQEEDPFS